MPGLKKAIVVFDLETGSLGIDTCEVVEVACLALDPVTLRPLPGSEFSSRLRPENFDNLQPEALRVNGLSVADLEVAPPRAVVMRKFFDHVKRFSMTGAMGKPIAAGKNIRAFDLPILDRVSRQLKCATEGGRQKAFDLRTQFDIEDDLFRWFGHSEAMPNLKMDTVREHFGMPAEGAHTAMVDVRQTAWLVAQFLGLYRRQAERVKFAGSARTEAAMASGLL
jgi:DNA polymerase III epsilon subunit-like protein